MYNRNLESAIFIRKKTYRLSNENAIEIPLPVIKSLPKEYFFQSFDFSPFY